MSEVVETTGQTTELSGKEAVDHRVFCGYQVSRQRYFERLELSDGNDRRCEITEEAPINV